MQRVPTAGVNFIEESEFGFKKKKYRRKCQAECNKEQQYENTMTLTIMQNSAQFTSFHVPKEVYSGTSVSQ